MEVNKKIIKALASDKKVEILKNLTDRRKTPAELSKELSIAPSTTTEHLKDLEELGLVKRMETGHKWIYYELTQIGRNLIKPSFPIQIILTISLGFIMIIGSFFGTFMQYRTQELMRAPAVAESTGKAYGETGAGTTAITNDTIFIAIFVIGIFLIIYGIWKLRKR